MVAKGGEVGKHRIVNRAERLLLPSVDRIEHVIGGLARGGFPALNAGGTPQTIEVYAFAPGIDPATLEVVVERGTLTLAGERKSSLPAEDRKTKVHINERFSGRFRRVVSLPDDADPDAVEAGYRDGVLHISVRRSESARPRRIEIQ